MKNKVFLISSVALLFALGGCGAGTTSSQASQSKEASESQSVVIPVTGVSFASKSLTLKTGVKEKLEYALLPANASNKNVSFTSSDPLVASVDFEGEVNTLKEGTTTIQITTSDGGFTDSLALSVQDSHASALEVTLQGNYQEKEGVYSIATDDQLTLLPSLTPADAVEQEVSFTSSDSEVLSVDKDGRLTSYSTAKDGVSVTVAVVGTSLSKTLLFNVLTSGDFALQELAPYQAATKAKELTSSLSEHFVSSTTKDTLTSVVLEKNAAISDSDIQETTTGDTTHEVRTLYEASLASISLSEDYSQVLSSSFADSLTEDEKALRLSGLLVDGHYGLASYVFDDFFSETHFDSPSKKKLSCTISTNGIDLVSHYTGVSPLDGSSTSYLSKSLHLVVDGEKVISEANYRFTSYLTTVNPFKDDGTIASDAVVESDSTECYSATYGTRSASSHPLDVGSYFYSDFTCYFSNNGLSSGKSEEYCIGESYYPIVDTFLPATASGKVDPIHVSAVKDVSGTSVVSVLADQSGFQVLSIGSAEITLSNAKGNVTKSYTITTQYAPADRLILSHSFTSIVAGNKVSNVTVDVAPYNSEKGTVIGSLNVASTVATITRLSNKDHSNVFEIAVLSSATEQDVTATFTSEDLSSSGTPVTCSFSFHITAKSAWSDSDILARLTGNSWTASVDECALADDDAASFKLSFTSSGTGTLVVTDTDSEEVVVNQSFSFTLLNGVITLSSFGTGIFKDASALVLSADLSSITISLYGGRSQTVNSGYEVENAQTLALVEGKSFTCSQEYSGADDDTCSFTLAFASGKGSLVIYDTDIDDSVSTVSFTYSVSKGVLSVVCTGGISKIVPANDGATLTMSFNSRTYTMSKVAA